MSSLTLPEAARHGNAQETIDKGDAALNAVERDAFEVPWLVRYRIAGPES